MPNMPSYTAGWYGPGVGPGVTPAPPLDSPQYGPAWVADCIDGTTHEQRLSMIANADEELGDHLRTTGSRDQVARVYSTLFAEERES